MLISPKMLAANKQLHTQNGFGGSGWKHAEAIVNFAAHTKAKSILDYGCGEGTLRLALGKGFRFQTIAEFGPETVTIAGQRWPGKVYEYDPAVAHKTKPRPADLVVCTDVLEHVEPKCLDNVLRHIRKLARRGAYLSIATRPSNKCFPSGKNVHLIIRRPHWWIQRIERCGLRIMDWEAHRFKDDSGCHHVTITVR